MLESASTSGAGVLSHRHLYKRLGDFIGRRQLSVAERPHTRLAAGTLGSAASPTLGERSRLALSCSLELGDLLVQLFLGRRQLRNLPLQLRDQPHQLVALRGREVFGLTYSQSIKTCSVPHNPPTDADPANQLLIIFDGLDEVPASSNRDQVLDAIKEFWLEASNANADVLAIATSRPQGYNEDFSALYYSHRQLAELSDELGWHFAQRLAEVRYRTDEDRKQKVLERLKRAFRDGSTARLMRSPLQVTIMTALVDRVGQPPKARWNLFKSYYDVIYLREVERSIPASNILRDYEPDIRAIHNQVGLILQIDSERTGRTDAKLSRDRFVSLVEARLEAEGHAGKRLSTLAQDIVEAASQRLVFLVEVESEQIGFEIRSLQEFMAAESLMDGADQRIRKRLREIALIPFWRNVFL